MQLSNHSDDEPELDALSNSGMSSSCPSSSGFFQAAERKVPNLRRGWCTPDPSPTHDGAAGLPACSVLKLSMQRLEELPSTHLEKMWPSSTLARSQACSRASSRSTSPSSHSSPCRTRTPSPQRNYYPRSLACSPGVASMNCPPAVGWYADPSESSTLLNIEDFSAWVMVPMVERAVFTIGTCEVERDASKGDESESVPSMGSKGHPYNCAEACKYACKSRGCKDGLSCSRCHLCDWRNRKRICKF